ncbi:MAG: DUF2752 domain-containing protein [Candidatus Geothermincolia bacterium]
MSSAVEINPPLAMPASGREAIVSRVWIERSTVRRRFTHEAPLLVLAAGVVALSFLLPTLKSHHAWLNIPCVFHAVTRLPCLACGLTRSFVFTAHGNFFSAFEMHLLGPVLFFGACTATVYLGASVVSGYRVRYDLSRRVRRIAFWSVLGIFLLCWGIKLAFIRGGW